MKPQAKPCRHRRELLVILLMTFIGGLIRVWSLPHLGLVHFDEGIYALAGLWPVLPGGFWGIDPSSIAYAPGGFPFLAGAFSFMLGPSDVSGILASILMGTLTVPLVGWLAWRMFGPTAGAISATFAAFSGFHIAFSRMALTDASFLFFFLLALGMGRRFLESPKVRNTVALGLAVGLAQWFKYHGWMAGAIVAAAALLKALLDPAERQPRRFALIWGQGMCAAAIAFAVFWPWFRFVEMHGGYSNLLRHHASYMQGFRSWSKNLNIQLDQVVALSPQGTLKSIGVLAVFLVLVFLRDNWRTRIIGPGGAIALAGVLAMSTFGGLLGWALGITLAPFLLLDGKRIGAGQGGSLLLGAWIAFSLLTPFYHPYARLWLPLEALGWLMLGCMLSALVTEHEPLGRGRFERTKPIWCVGSILIIGALLGVLRPGPGHQVFTAGETSLGAPSDSVRIACRQLQTDLPKNLTRLRFLGRPSITFYLVTVGIPIAPQAGLDELLKPGIGSDLALVDDALLRQESDHDRAKARLLDSWEVVHEYSTILNTPTLLDLDPGIAKRAIEPNSRACPLWLLRPRGKDKTDDRPAK